jgi:hypothetical protein
MGLRQLEWHEQKHDGWVARVVETYFDGRSKPLTRRYAHVDIYPWALQGAKQRVEGKILVHMQYGPTDLSWHDSIEAAKLYVEAIFALDN